MFHFTCLTLSDIELPVVSKSVDIDLLSGNWPYVKYTLHLMSSLLFVSLQTHLPGFKLDNIRRRGAGGSWGAGEMRGSELLRNAPALEISKEYSHPHHNKIHHRVPRHLQLCAWLLLASTNRAVHHALKRTSVDESRKR